MMQKATILVVEDHEVNRVLLKSILLARGFNVLEATNGHECLAVAKEHLPSLVLMDIGLPDIDGLRATRELKLHPSTSNIPVVALTAHAFASDKVRALAAGCSAFLTKPVSMNELVATIKDVLSHQPSCFATSFKEPTTSETGAKAI